jgi:hypothetical protein
MPLSDHAMLERVESGQLKWLCRRKECRRMDGDKNQVRRGYLSGTFFERVDSRRMIKNKITPRKRIFEQNF